jgi:hypothetical protein
VLAAEKGWSVEQLDVKTAFLNGDLSDELYLRLPKELGVGRCGVAHEEGHLWT